MWQVPSTRSEDSNTRSTGNVSSLATRTMSPTWTDGQKDTYFKTWNSCAFLGLLFCVGAKIIVGFSSQNTFKPVSNPFKNHRVQNSYFSQICSWKNKNTVSTRCITKKPSSLIQRVHKLHTRPLCRLYTGCPVCMFYWSWGCRGGSWAAFSYPRGSKW